MNTFVSALALCAAIGIYPAGLSGLLVAGLTAGSTALPGPGPRHRRGRWGTPRLGPPLAALPVLLLVGIGVCTLPWPGSPVRQFPLAGPPLVLGGPALAVAALWAADLGARPRWRGRTGPTAAGWRRVVDWDAVAHLLWIAPLLGLGLWFHGASWESVLGPTGAGALTARVVVGALVATLLPTLSGAGPAGGPVSWPVAIRWAGHAAVCTFLWAPDVA
ncbi:MAG TPA: hypothetical protein VMW49_07130, partial [Candidatus Dormibacteraeota bacterium]|nr:hypothetical protein [Candidatus Dormibacteraeota bacterium]